MTNPLLKYAALVAVLTSPIWAESTWDKYTNINLVAASGADRIEGNPDIIFVRVEQ